MARSKWYRMFRLLPPHPLCPCQVADAVFGGLRNTKTCNICKVHTTGGSARECFEDRRRRLNDWPVEGGFVPPEAATASGPRGWHIPTVESIGRVYVDALGLIEGLDNRYRSKMGKPQGYHALWNANEVYIRMTQDTVMLHHTMRFKDAEGRVDPTGPLATFLLHMRTGTSIPRELWQTVFADRLVADAPARGDTFPVASTMHIAPGDVYLQAGPTG